MPQIKTNFICTVPDCERESATRQLCSAHYTRLQRYGDVQADIPIKIKQPSFCTVEGCDAPCYGGGNGLCGMHYQRVYKGKGIQPEVSRRVWSETGVCFVDGCGGKVQAYGLCGPHDMRAREYGDPLAGPPLVNDMPKVCTAGDCDRKVMALGLCNIHNKRMKAWGDPMPDVPIRPVRTEPCPDGFKWCSQCCEELPLSDFGPKSNQSDGLNRWCYVCVWKRHIFKTYTITWQDYCEMWMSQDGKCATCHRPETMADANGRVRRLCVDHDHNHCSGETSCGKCVRGLLCNVCNRTLGMLNDDPLLLMEMADYVIHHKDRTEILYDDSDVQTEDRHLARIG